MQAVVFDLGNVLIEWNPRRLFTEECIAEIDFFAWNATLDNGAPFAEVVAEVRQRFPHRADAIEAFRDRWPDILGPVDADVVAIVDELRARRVALYLLTNSSAETLPRSAAVTDLLKKFDGAVISGEIGIMKPARAIFDHTIDRFALDPSATWFVDDSQANVDAAVTAGWRGIHFTDAATLRAELTANRLL